MVEEIIKSESNAIINNELKVSPSMEAETVELTEEKENRKAAIIGGIVVFVLIAGLIASFIFLLRLETDSTAKIRDIFIIFMALESLVIGLVLIILVIQIAKLTNLLQNEIKPILNSTNETVSTLRGTTKFLSDTLVEPVIKLNEYLAGFQSFIKIILPDRKKKKS